MLLCFAINCLLVISCVLIHYGFMAWVSFKIDNLKVQHRVYLLLHVFDGLAAHILEIFLFAVVYYMMEHHFDLGHLEGVFDGTFFDCFYFSFTSYTSVGFGDITPVGFIRFTVAIEALLGLMMITWTASLLYLAMQRQWSEGFLSKQKTKQ
ncbi:MAG: potassium channel family protein [Cellvibrionales bacterium]|nr:potassium channel family protein [Cellvibrionales bacterium]